MAGFKLKSKLLSTGKAPSNDALLCIDFGTAMCKAAAFQKSNGKLLLLRLGEAARDPSNTFPVASSLFLSREGTLLFGHEAIDESLRQRGVITRRIESIKKWLSDGPLVDLDSIPVDADCNPTRYSFSRGDALTLLLAYVTDMAGEELERHRLSRLTMRRFTRPVWHSERAKWYDDVIQRHLVRAQVVADTLSGLWSGGIPMNVVREVLEQVRNADIPSWLVNKSAALEPIAAGIGRLERDYQQRSLAVVIDVGAGTTDMASMAVIQHDDTAHIARAVPQGTPSSILKAGDLLDTILVEEILSTTRFAAADVPSAQAQAEQNVRRWKEQLFRAGEVRPTFAGGRIGKAVELQSFLALGKVKSFERDIEKQFAEQLSSLAAITELFDSSAYHRLERIALVPAGGGARLPIVNKLASGIRHIGKSKVPVSSMGCEPAEFRKTHAQASDVFPQLAVAIGGSSPNYPEQPDQRAGFVRRLGRL
jgi:hypothetical protein